MESGRVDGKPRIVWQKYLGTVDAIIKMAEGQEPENPREVDIFELGGATALYDIAQRLGLEETVDEVVPNREQGPSVGRYMLLAAINRALAPCSKLAIGDWYGQTVLRRLWRHSSSAFSSQRFWDHMDMVSQGAIAEIEERLASRIVSVFGLSHSLLLYDTTNFYTFIATSNERAGLPARGRSKAKRHDLRQVGLALLVARDFGIPLMYRLYAGDIPDVSLFPSLAGELLKRYEKLGAGKADVTLVFDKENVSDAAMEELALQGVHFVTALSATRDPELLATPLERFSELEGMPGTRAFACSLPLSGRDLRAVVCYSESFFSRQLGGVTSNLARCQTKLKDLESSLLSWRRGKRRGRKPKPAGVWAKEILAPQFMASLFQTEVSEKEGLPTLAWRLDHDALRALAEERLGRTLLVTDRGDWSAREVIGAYRALSSIEETFRSMKNTHFLSWQPAWHWTDQKLRVHALYCVLALTLATLAHKVVTEAGIDLSLAALLKELSAIREVAIIYPSGRGRGKIILSRMSARQKKLFDLLEIGAFTSR
ncbi:MAG: IS1634 family transposase [Actinomycetota bacterium]|nr:IS1634 family transposase [Actinomycetota bacterium]